MKHIFAAFCCVIFVSTADRARAQIFPSGEKVQIVDVEVVTHKRYVGSANFVEEVRYLTQNAAYKFSEEGTEKKLRILLRILKVSSPGRAVTSSGSSSIRVTAYLIDKKWDVVQRKFKARARIYRLGGIIGAIAIAAEDIDHVQEEKRLAQLLAKRLMTRIYGEEHAKSVETRQPTKQVKPSYPMSWEDAGRKFQCEKIQSDNSAAAGVANDNDGGGPGIRKLPDYCGGYLKTGG